MRGVPSPDRGNFCSVAEGALQKPPLILATLCGCFPACSPSSPCVPPPPPPSWNREKCISWGTFKAPASHPWLVFGWGGMGARPYSLT